MKRQTSGVSPSSSRRENAPEKIHAKTIGCMSGILHLISGSNRRQRRFLTFGNKKNPKNNASSAVSSVAAGEIPKEQRTSEVSAGRNSRSPCEVPRSPTLPAEIRLSSRSTKPQSPTATAESRSPALVARLMGLEAAPADSPAESVAEKRRKLLGALQRCDEDLKALKKIIEAVQLTDPLPPEESKTAGEFEGKIKTVSEVKCSVFNGEQQQPSPVSVLDEFTRSPLSPSCHSGRHSFGRIQHQLQQKQQQLLKKPGEEEINSTYMYERMTSELLDLIEEVVRELGCFYTLPFEACKRRLCF
ncbi:hypothetical protein PIB30_035225 [Stylosanthes scabra]|uniref:DUF3741 domain-containing protein n=1 Tax=Stylosanthes scabra TaxID=79078 RepID=A0ABU6TF85_9FABA|nr:hypothetical protein [Stylosanthes scabra]